MSATELTSITNGRTDSEAGSSLPPPPTSRLMRLLREPLLHFLILGAALFVVYSSMHRDEIGAAGDPSIVVSAGKIEHLAALFTRTWQRPPTRTELDNLINDYVREEAAYREGTAMGLDRNDTIIRRRIRQKLDFVAEDLAVQTQPTEADLAKYLQEHADDFRVSPRLTFRHVFLDPARHGEDLANVVNHLVDSLRTDPSLDAREQGDRTLLDFRHDDVSQREVANLFGEKFAAALVDCEPHTWQGPIHSAYGVHAAIVDEFQSGQLPDLDDVRDAVRREWEHARRQQLAEEYYLSLLNKYEVLIEWPELDVETE